MITGTSCLRICSVMITDWETNFIDLQANDFWQSWKNSSGNILVGNHAVMLTEIIYTEQMDVKGLGRKLLLTPSGDPPQKP